MAASESIDAKKNDLEFAMAASRSFTRYSRELLNNGRPSDVTQTFSDLYKWANELLKRDLETGDWITGSGSLSESSLRCSGRSHYGQINA